MFTNAASNDVSVAELLGDGGSDRDSIVLDAHQCDLSQEIPHIDQWIGNCEAAEVSETNVLVVTPDVAEAMEIQDRAGSLIGRRNLFVDIRQDLVPPFIGHDAAPAQSFHLAARQRYFVVEDSRSAEFGARQMER